MRQLEICSFTVFPEYASVPKEGERVQGPLGNCLQDMGVSHPQPRRRNKWLLEGGCEGFVGVQGREVGGQNYQLRGH